MTEDLQDLLPTLVTNLEECHAMWKRVPRPALEDGPAALHKHLVATRRSLDRVEEIVAGLIRLKGRSYATLLAARARLESAEDKAYDSRALSFEEYSTGREKTAWVSTRTVVEKAEVHRVQVLDTEIGAALEEAKLIQRSIDSMRRDNDARLRIMTFERQSRTMKCAECRQPIAPRDQKQAVFEKDESGRIVAAYHKHHARRARTKARTGGAVPGLVYNADRPSAYDVERVTADHVAAAPEDGALREREEAELEALHRRQDEIAEQRDEEDVPREWTDWREPVTVSLDDLIAEAESEEEP